MVPGVCVEFRGENGPHQIVRTILHEPLQRFLGSKVIVLVVVLGGIKRIQGINTSSESIRIEVQVLACRAIDSFSLPIGVVEKEIFVLLCRGLPGRIVALPELAKQFLVIDVFGIVLQPETFRVVAEVVIIGIVSRTTRVSYTGPDHAR